MWENNAFKDKQPIRLSYPLPHINKALINLITNSPLCQSSPCHREDCKGILQLF